MSVDSPKAQISGGKAAKISQRVEDNAFHLVKRELTDVERGAAIRGKCGEVSSHGRSCHIGDDIRLNCAADPSDLVPSPRGDGVTAFVEFDVIDEGLDRFTR
jgi:hypothetical protein